MTNMEKRLQMAASNPNHAYILTGEPEEILSIARAFAKALQCETRVDGCACGLCLSCRVFESGNHPDILYVKATKTKTIGVDDVRTQIILPMSVKPFLYRYKIFIVDQAPTPQAQNALLKTVEEPAPFGIFLFLAKNLELFLPTVISRCTAIKLSKAGNANPRAKDEDIEEMQNFAGTVVNSIRGMDIIEVFDLCSRFDKWKESIQTFLDILYLCFREQLTSSADALPRLDAVAAAKKSLYQNGNFQMTIETMLLKMR